MSVAVITGAGGLIEIGAHTHTHADHRGNPEAFLFRNSHR